MGKSTIESSYCAEDEDAEEERGRAKLQTASEVEGFPSFLWGSRRITLLLISTAGRDKDEHTFCLKSTSVFVLFQSVCVPESLQFDCCLSMRPVKDIPLTDIHHQHYRIDFLLITVSTIRADSPVMRKLEPDRRCLGK